MHRIKSLNLDCLIIDLHKGREFQPLFLSDDIWGETCNPGLLVDLLRSAKPEKWLRETLVAAHLFYPDRTPKWARPWLRQNAFDVMGADLAALEQARWMRFHVPVADEKSSDSVELIVGVGLELPLVAQASRGAFASDSVAALEVVDRLIRQKWRTGCCFGLISPGVIGLCGPSLALPAYLAAAACHEGLVNLQILATGGLDDSGRVLSVNYVPSKLNSARVTPKLFLYPQDNDPPASAVECVPVSHVSEALEVAVCHKEGIGLMIVQAEKALDAGKGLASVMCSFSGEMFFWLKRNRDRVAVGLASDGELMDLVQRVKVWCDSTMQNKPDLGNAVLLCLPLELVRSMSSEKTLLAWSISFLQMERCNHSGMIAEFEKWKELADNLRPQIFSFQEGGRLLALQYVQSIIGERHNRYVFTEVLPEHAEVMIEVLGMQEAFKLRQAQGRCREDGSLGRYHGTLGQNYGFCGPGYLEKCLTHLDQAIACFCADSFESAAERNRDMLYKVFALSSAGRTNEALELLRGIENVWRNEQWNMEMGKYQVHALLRVHVDSGNGMCKELWEKISALWKQARPIDHPWQLILYNLGLLASDSEAKYRMLLDSVDCCLSSEAGQTIKIMALLPLAELHASGYHSTDMENQVQRACFPLQTQELSQEHFACLKQEKKAADVLSIVQKEKNNLFPYMYR